MAYTERSTSNVWAFGRQYRMALWNCGVHLQNCAFFQSRPAGGIYQIALHYTAGRNPATSAVSWWNRVSSDARAAAAADTPPRTTWTRTSADFVVERTEHIPDGSHEHRQRHSRIVQVVNDVERHRSCHMHALTQHSVGIEIANFGCQSNRATLGETLTENDYLRWPEDRTHIGNCGDGYYDAFQDTQYRGLILLLRYLCIRFEISRKFIGQNAQDQLRLYMGSSDESTLRNFRGIFSHCNVDNSKHKACGGAALARNRLYRGITEEWWMPLGGPRTYYTGPFAQDQNLVPASPNEDRTATPLAHANLEALQEARSYFQRNISSLLTGLEGSSQGQFPKSSENRCWHAGIHITPDAANSRVYAAASGTIVAARLGIIPAPEDPDPSTTSSDEPSEAEVRGVADPSLNSIGFVLIKHAVYDTITASRFNYSVPPKTVFSLYMHLAPLPQAGDQAIDVTHAAFADHPGIPPWFKLWRNQHRSAEINQLFFPNVEILVGDFLGSCGRWYSHERCLHFEIFSKHLLGLTPWSAASNQHQNAQAYAPPSSQLPPGPSAQLRDTACRHLNEWALREQDFNQIFYEDTARGQALDSGDMWARREVRQSAQFIWNSLVNRIQWYHAARQFWQGETGNPLAQELLRELPANGILWHYHPLVLMKAINDQVANQGDFAGNTPSSIRALHTHTFVSRTSIPIARHGSGTERRDVVDVPYFFST